MIFWVTRVSVIHTPLSVFAAARQGVYGELVGGSTVWGESSDQSQAEHHDLADGFQQHHQGGARNRVGTC